MARLGREVRRRARKRVLVATPSGQFDGILWGADQDVVVLRSVSLITEAGTTPMDGEVVVRWPTVEFVQVLG